MVVTAWFLCIYSFTVEITYVRKYQISHFSHHVIPNSSSFYCACALHICKAVLFSLSPPYLLLSYIWVLHMTLTHQMQLPDLICDLLTSCIWNHRLEEKLWHRAGDRGVPHSRFLQENTRNSPAPAQDNTLPCHTPSVPWRHAHHSPELQGHLEFCPPLYDRIQAILCIAV